MSINEDKNDRLKTTTIGELVKEARPKPPARYFIGFRDKNGTEITTYDIARVGGIETPIKVLGFNKGGSIVFRHPKTKNLEQAPLSDVEKIEAVTENLECDKIDGQHYEILEESMSEQRRAGFFKSGEVFKITVNPEDKATFSSILKSWVDELFADIDPEYKEGVLNREITIDDVIEDFYDEFDWNYMVDDSSQIIPLLKDILIAKIDRLRGGQV